MVVMKKLATLIPNYFIFDQSFLIKITYPITFQNYFEKCIFHLNFNVSGNGEDIYKIVPNLNEECTSIFLNKSQNTGLAVCPELFNKKWF